MVVEESGIRGSSIAQNLPRIWSKDRVTEIVSKVGGEVRDAEIGPSMTKPEKMSSTNGEPEQ